MPKFVAPIINQVVQIKFKKNFNIRKKIYILLIQNQLKQKYKFNLFKFVVQTIFKKQMAKRQTSNQRDEFIISKHNSANQQIFYQRTQPKVAEQLPGIGINIMKGNTAGLSAESVYASLNQGKQEQLTESPCKIQIKDYSQCVRRNPHLKDCQNYSDTLRTCRQLNSLF